MTSTASVPTHAVAVPTFGKFFLPGPTDVHPEVLEAMIRPMVGHRSGAMEKLLQNVAPKLGAVARTSRPVFIGTNSATDRKSTRLNSSHQIISYAVFCLKKKKKTKIYITRFT